MVQGESYENVTSLRSALLASYHSDVVPLKDQTQPLNINLTLYLYNIPDVDAVKGSLTLSVQILAEWFDEKLTWTPADYDGVSEIFITSSDVWTPFLTIGNPVEFKKLDQSWMQVHYTSDGHAFFSTGDIIQYSCTYYMKYWPFDMQICPLTIFPFRTPTNKVLLSVTDTVVNTDSFKPNPEWTLMSDSITYEVDSSSSISQITYNIRLARQPGFYMLTVIMPISGVAMLMSLVFLLPSESGERMGYSVTIMLALAVFLTVTAADLPKTSEPTPIMCIYIMYNMLICMGSVVLVMLNLGMYHRDHKQKVTLPYKILVQISKCGFCTRNKIVDVTNDTELESGNVKGQKTSPKKISKVGLTKIDVAPRQSSFESQPNDEKDKEITWKDVSFAIDRLALIALLIITSIPSVAIMVYLSLATDFVS